MLYISFCNCKPSVANELSICDITVLLYFLNQLGKEAREDAHSCRRGDKFNAFPPLATSASGRSDHI